MASAVVRSGPEPEKLAKTSAAAHTVVDRGMFIIMFEALRRNGYVDAVKAVLWFVILQSLGLESHDWS